MVEPDGPAREPHASWGVKQGIQAWGARLSDKMRGALVDGDVAAAWQLALHGDGQTRDLEREYAFMIHGLGFTLKVLLRLLLETASRGQAPNGVAVHVASAAEADLATLLTRLLQVLRDGAEDNAPSLAAGTPPTLLADACICALEAGQERFTLDQARRADEVVQALAQGQAEPAMGLLDAKDQAYLALHDTMVRFMADSFAWVVRHFGTKALLDFHLAAAEGQRAGFQKWEQMPAAEFAAMTAFLLKQHMGQVEVREDERRFTIHQSLCGSGGRLRIGGAYDGPQSLPFVEGPDPLTFGEACMPVYCTHCAIWNGTATLNWFGRAQWVFEQPSRQDGSCTLHIYKRREDIPADYARSVGLPPAHGLS
jgi:hypothetical protein